MSSAISTDPQAAPTRATPGGAQTVSGADGDRAAFRPWHFFIVGALIAATAAVLLSSSTAPEHLVMLSVTVFAAGAAAYACYRMLVPLVGPPPAGRAGFLGAIARRALEREKAIVLRSIKELEFDRAMGKVADADFAEMSGRLRQRAIRLMQQLDDVQSVARARVERELGARLGGPRVEDPGVARPTCRACSTVNDVDAKFCKHCGGALAA